MERLTRPNVTVDETAAKFMGKEVKLQDINDRLLDLVLNGPTLNAVSKDVLRQLIRQLYNALKKHEDNTAPTLKVICGITGTACVDCKGGSCEARRMGVPSHEV